MDYRTAFVIDMALEHFNFLAILFLARKDVIKVA